MGKSGFHLKPYILQQKLSRMIEYLFEQLQGIGKITKGNKIVSIVSLLASKPILLSDK